MAKISAIALLTVFVFGVNGQYADVCYGDLGCFTTRPPFSTTLARPVALLPARPEQIDTTFYLYTRKNISPSTIDFNTVSANFLDNTPTKVIIHGFLQNHDKKWIAEMKNALLENENCNVIAVEWSKGSGFPYTKATANTQVVGAEISRLLNSLIAEDRLSGQQVHLIGHNLGAHVAGYVSLANTTIARITGLDPAGPYFENTDARVRLDESDADFVDVIHTDGAQLLKLGVGLMQRSGHVDFYPNGGENQPGCPSTSSKLINGILSLGQMTTTENHLGCNSLASTKFFTDSILNRECTMYGYTCDNLEKFNNGECLQCKNGCNRMGYYAKKTFDNDRLFLTTQGVDKFPYCQFHYQVTLESAALDTQKQTRGVVTVELEGERGSSLPVVFDDSQTTLKPGDKQTRLITSFKNLGTNVKSASVQFRKTSRLLSSWLYQDEWAFSSVAVFDASRQTDFKLCYPTSASALIKSGASLRFTKC